MRETSGLEWEFSPKIRFSGRNYRESRFCSFGITESIAAALVAAGVGASTAAIAAPVILSAGEGAAFAGITGGDPLQGAITSGATTGLGNEFGAGLGGALGVGIEGGDALIGAASGAVASGITGNDPLQGTIQGGVGGLFQGLQAGGDLASLGIGNATPSVGGSGTGEAAGGGDFIGTATPSSAVTTGAIPATTATGAPPANFGTSTPIGGTSAVSSSLSASGGGLPSGALGGDLTSSGLTVDGGIGAGSAGSNIAGGGVSAPTISPNLGTISSAAPDLGSVAPAASKGLFGTGITGGELVEGGLLGYGLLSQNKQSAADTAPLTSSAAATSAQDAALGQQAANLQPQIAALNAESQSLAAPLVSGAPLPAGAQQSITNATQAQKAQVRSTYASLGLSGSSMEAQALASIDAQAGAQTFSDQNALFADSNTAFNQANTTANQALSLIQAGQNGTSMNNQLYESILNTQLQQDKELQDSISNFASSVLGTPANTNLTIKTG